MKKYFYRLLILGYLVVVDKAVSSTQEECYDAIERSKAIDYVISEFSSKLDNIGTYFFHQISQGYLYEYHIGRYDSVLIYTGVAIKENQANVFITSLSKQLELLDFLSRQVDLSLRSHLYCSSQYESGLTFCCIFEGEKRNRKKKYKAILIPNLFGAVIKL